jgi:hypothetical protein
MKIFKYRRIPLCAAVAIFIPLCAQWLPTAPTPSDLPPEALEPSVPEILNPRTIDEFLAGIRDPERKARVLTALAEASLVIPPEAPDSVDPTADGPLQIILSPPTLESIVEQAPDAATRRERLLTCAEFLQPKLASLPADRAADPDWPRKVEAARRAIQITP